MLTYCFAASSRLPSRDNPLVFILRQILPPQNQRLLNALRILRQKHRQITRGKQIRIPGQCVARAFSRLSEKAARRARPAVLQ